MVERMRWRCTAAAIAALFACNEGGPIAPLGCPAGTMLVGEECQADLTPPAECNPACTFDEVCVRGRCAVADVNGHWEGVVSSTYDCDTNGSLFGGTFPLIWDVAQTGTVALVQDALGPIYTAAIEPDRFRATYLWEAANARVEVELAGVLSLSGNAILGSAIGSISQSDYADPSHPLYNPEYRPPCRTGGLTSFRIDRRAQGLAVPSLDDLWGGESEARWEGPFAYHARCPGTASGLYDFELRLVLTMRFFEDGRVDATSVEWKRGDQTLFAGPARGNFSGEELHLDEGRLDNPSGAIHFEPPSPASSGEWGLRATLSRDGNALVGRLDGWADVFANPDFPLPCPFESSFMMLERTR
jgi:hypothetical protein